MTSCVRKADVGALLAAAADLGPRLPGIEINPLLVNGDQATVLDTLILVSDA